MTEHLELRPGSSVFMDSTGDYHLRHRGKAGIVATLILPFGVADELTAALDASAELAQYKSDFRDMEAAYASAVDDGIAEMDSLREMVAIMRAERDQAKKANEALLRERNTWARQIADVRDELATAESETDRFRSMYGEADSERMTAELRVEDLTAELAADAEAVTDRAIDEHERHHAQYSTVYDGRGGVTWQDDGGLRCSCGWTEPPTGYVRPWRKWHEHVLTSVAALAAGAGEQR